MPIKWNRRALAPVLPIIEAVRHLFRGCREKDRPAPIYIWKTARRRAFFIPVLRRHDRFGGGGEEFVSVCPLAAVVLRFAGVHF